MNNLLFDNLEIRRFRTFNYIKVEQLGHVNLFLGKNNVGKSTLLEALWLHARMGSPEVIQTILEERDEPRVLRHGRESEPTPWSLFHGHPPLERISSSIQIGRIGAPDSALVLSIVWLSESMGEGLGLEKNEFTGAEFPDHQEGKTLTPALEVKYGSMRRLLRLDKTLSGLRRWWSLQDRSNQDFSTPCIFIGPHGLDHVILQSLWEKVALSDAKNDVIEAMRIIAPEIDDFALLPSDSGASSIRVRVRNEEAPIPLKTMGDGMNRLFRLGIALAGARDGILLVDEIENGIHWTALPDLWKFILKVARRLHVQVFATTHANDCLKSFHHGTGATEDMTGVAARIEKKEGEFVAEIFDENRLAVIVKEGIEIR